MKGQIAPLSGFRLGMKFTIVTPSYNKGAYLQRTIESVLQQRCPGVELDYWIVDNFSTDETIAVLEHYQNHPELTILRYRDRGQADAINSGWQRGTGEIYAWLNADDIYLEHAIAQVAQYFQQHPQVMAIYGEAIYIDPQDQPLKPVTNIRDYSRQRLLSHDFITQPATFIRREVFEQVGLLSLDYRYGFDWDYWLRISQRWEFVRVPFQLAGYRITGDNLTTTGGGKRFREMLTIVWRHGGLLALLRFLGRLVRKYLTQSPEIPTLLDNASRS